MTRGFVTIATGRDNYYKIAANLLRSYRYHSADPEPFAIICDRKNRYTEMFDQVIIMEDPLRSYVDKLRLPEYLPFDENIFVDSDCLVYKDLNDFWKIFEDGSVFSAFGKNLPLDSKYGWFRIEDTGVYRDQVRYIPDFIGGVYYFRKSPELEKFYEIVNHIRSTYHDYRFRLFEDVCDEPVYALAMAVCDYKTAGEKSPDICFYPFVTYYESDIAAGKIVYESRFMEERGRIPEAYMVHWGSGNTRDMTYLLEDYRLDRACSGKEITKAGLAMAKLRISADIGARIVYSKLKKAMKR